MKLLQLQWGFLLGGGSRYVQMLERMASRYDIVSHCLCVLDPRWASDEDGLSRIAHTRIATHGRFDPSWVDPVAEQIRGFKPDLLMTHGFNAHFVAWIAQMRSRTHIPVVCSYHGPYHPVNARTRMLGVVYERFTEHFFRRDASAVVTVAEHARQRLVERGVPQEKITVIPNAIEDRGTPASRAEARALWRGRWGVKGSETLIGAIGRMDPVKGHAHLIAAFDTVAAVNPDVRLVLVGDGPERNRLEDIASHSRFATRILFVGQMSRAAETLPAFDIYVLPSLSECHSIALLEAMCAGLPIIATAVGGNVETITNDCEGLLCPPADAHMIAISLLRLIQDRAFALSLGVAARARFLREFTQDAMMQKTAGWLAACGSKAN